MRGTEVGTSVAVTVVVCAAALAAGPAAADLSTTEWRVRCAASSDQVMMDIDHDLRGRGFDCRYSVPDRLGDREILVVPEVTRRAIEQALTEVSAWYDGHGFPAPLINDIHQIVPSSTPEGASAAGLDTPMRLGPVENATQGAPFLAILDPLPVLEITEAGAEKFVLGYYYSSERILVVSLDAVRGPDGAYLAIVPMVDRDTIAHEMFHAILAGISDEGRPQFIEEGLAEFFGRLYVADRFPDLAPHPLRPRLTQQRFTAHALNADGRAAYDSAVFWRHVHDNVVDGIPAFLRLVTDYDLTLDEKGSGTADAWLRDETGQTLMEVWRGFARRISAEAADAGLLDRLVTCADATPVQVDPTEDSVFRHRAGAMTLDSYTMSCLRIRLPRTDATREIFIEDIVGDPHPRSIDIFAEGNDLRGQRLIVPAGQEEIILIAAPFDTDLGHAPTEISVPPLNIVVEAPRTGCDTALVVQPEDLTARQRQMMQTLAGRWQEWHFAVSANYSCPGFDLRDDRGQSAASNVFALRYEAGTLVPSYGDYTFHLVPGATGLTDIPQYAESCGTEMIVGSDRIVSTDWVREGVDDPILFLVERPDTAPGSHRCVGVAMFGDDRMLTLTPLLGLAYWESTASIRVQP
jgi:hypothetical protein